MHVFEFTEIEEENGKIINNVQYFRKYFSQNITCTWKNDLDHSFFFYVFTDLLKLKPVWGGTVMRYVLRVMSHECEVVKSSINPKS